MNEEGGEGNNRYGLRNRERIDRAGEEVEEEGEEEDDEGEEGRDRQRRRVNEEDPEEEDSDDDGLEVPRDLNLDDDAVADAAANNQGRGGQNRNGAPPRGPAAAAAAAAAANNQGRGGGNRAGAPQGPAAAAAAAANNNQGHGGGNRAGAPQGPGGRAGVAAPAAAVNPINRMETPFRPYVENRVQAYQSPFNDPTRETAMRSAEAHAISLQHLVDNSNEERQKGEYMVCVLLAVTNSGTAQTRGRTNGRYGGPQQSTPYQRMFRCMCINSDSGRNAFTMFFGEGTGARMFHASMEQRDNGTFSENLCVCF
jgi:hypothetical protein